MTRFALMFSGQGAQYNGMGKDLYDRYQSVKDIYKTSEKISGYEVRKLSFDDNEELHDTKYTQVCMFTLYQAILTVLKEKNIDTEISMGLSLGEYGAYLHQGVFDFETGLKIIKKRGELMAKANSVTPGSMAAVIGLNESQLLPLIDDINGYVTIANYNAHQQLVISGEVDAVEALSKRAKEIGAKRVVPLKTSGAFHSELMRSARKEFLSFLNDQVLHEPKGRLYLNTTGKRYTDSIKQQMADQLTHSVRFYQMVEQMSDQDIDILIEIGPKKTLSALVRRINRQIKTYQIEDEATLLKTINDLEEYHGEL